MTIQEIRNECIGQAKLSNCKRYKCGSVIIDAENIIIGKGYNSPAGNEDQRCDTEKVSYDKKVTDKTCCVHAEQRAIFDALAKHPQKIKGSTLYFIRLSKTGEPQASADPYCTICSKSALDVGVGKFVLFHDLDNPTFYSTDEYNNLSYQYKQK